jgi:hypothetical protein
LPRKSSGISGEGTGPTRAGDRARDLREAVVTLAAIVEAFVEQGKLMDLASLLPYEPRAGLESAAWLRREVRVALALLHGLMK